MRPPPRPSCPRGRSPRGGFRGPVPGGRLPCARAGAPPGSTPIPCISPPLSLPLRYGGGNRGAAGTRRSGPGPAEGRGIPRREAPPSGRGAPAACRLRRAPRRAGAPAEGGGMGMRGAPRRNTGAGAGSPGGADLPAGGGCAARPLMPAAGGGTHARPVRGRGQARPAGTGLPHRGRGGDTRACLPGRDAPPGAAMPPRRTGDRIRDGGGIPRGRDASPCRAAYGRGLRALHAGGEEAPRGPGRRRMRRGSARRKAGTPGKTSGKRLRKKSQENPGKNFGKNFGKTSGKTSGKIGETAGKSPREIHGALPAGGEVMAGSGRAGGSRRAAGRPAGGKNSLGKARACVGNSLGKACIAAGAKKKVRRPLARLPGNAYIADAKRKTSKRSQLPTS